MPGRIEGPAEGLDEPEDEPLGGGRLSVRRTRTTRTPRPVRLPEGQSARRRAPGRVAPPAGTGRGARPPRPPPPGAPKPGARGTGGVPGFGCGPIGPIRPPPKAPNPRPPEKPAGPGPAPALPPVCPCRASSICMIRSNFDSNSCSRRSGSRGA